MSKKLLGIILVVLIVAIAGMVYFGFQKSFFTGKGIGGIGKKSLMDTAREKGQIVPSKTDAIKECEKETDQDGKDTCYGLVAFYYRDASLCKQIKDPEIKKNCNQENIETWYSEMEKGGATSPFIPGLPGGTIPGGEPAQPGTTNGGQETPILSGKMTDEIYIEILAQSSNPLQKDPKTWASDMKDLYKKYGITEEDITAYGKELEKDPQHAGEVGLKFIQRAQELRTTGK